MNILTYIKNLVHHFGKNQVQKSCEIAIDSLKAHTIPAYVSASELFKINKIKNKETLSYVDDYRRLVGLKNNATIIDSILDGLNKAVEVLEFVSSKSDSLYSEHESNVGLTFQKATYLQLASALTFANDFSRKFLNVVYILETENADKDSSLKDHITPIELSFVQSNFINFCTVMAVLKKDISKIEASVDSLPDAIVSDTSTKAFDSTLGEAKMDPLGFRNFTIPINVSVSWNPFYMFAMMYADFQNASYKAAKEELQLLQLRKVNLEKINEKKPDARIQQEIQYLGTRVSGLNYEVSQLEKRYAGA